MLLRFRWMRYRALATDYDGTLAEEGKVRRETLRALERLRKSGRRVILVTGRELEDLMRVCPDVGVFDEIVAENGALLYTPGSAAASRGDLPVASLGRGRSAPPGKPPLECPLAKPPPPEFVAHLRQRGVSPISCGRIIVATWQPHESVVLDVIREMGLELEVIFNKGAVMVLPSGVNKAFGLARALAKHRLPAEATIGVGDGENDHSLLGACGLGVAVANAVPALKERADLVMVHPRGDGVIELVEELLKGDLDDAETKEEDHRDQIAMAIPVVAHVR